MIVVGIRKILVFVASGQILILSEYLLISAIELKRLEASIPEETRNRFRSRETQLGEVFLASTACIYHGLDRRIRNSFGKKRKHIRIESRLGRSQFVVGGVARKITGTVMSMGCGDYHLFP